MQNLSLKVDQCEIHFVHSFVVFRQTVVLLYLPVLKLLSTCRCCVWQK